MNQLQVFDFEAKAIRTSVDDLGNIWWVARDICEALELKRPENSYSKVDQDDIADTLIQGDRQRRTQKIVNESGLYALIFQSETDAAKRFKRWLTSEVLPSIRKTGSYSSTSKEPQYSNAESVFKSLASVAQTFGLEGNQALLCANKATKTITGIDFQSILQIELKTPSQQRYLTPTEIGKSLGLTAQKINKKLQDLGLQSKKNDVWSATEEGKKYSVLMDTGKKHSNGVPVQQLKWIESVIEMIRF